MLSNVCVGDSGLIVQSLSITKRTSFQKKLLMPATDLLQEINDKMATARLYTNLLTIPVPWLSIFNKEYKWRKYLARNYGNLRARLLFADPLWWITYSFTNVSVAYLFGSGISPSSQIMNRCTHFNLCLGLHYEQQGLKTTIFLYRFLVG
jgi:hypothetical protein